jgi:hypothetical protein
MTKFRNWYPLIISISILFVIALSACGRKTESYQYLNLDEEDNITSSVEDASEEEIDQEQEQAGVVDEISACVECHSDKQMLIDTAKPEEEKESENEGVG